MNYETFTLTHDDGITTLTLNRPEKLNALSDKMITELCQVTSELKTDNSVKVVVITANGRAFSAGGDLNADIFTTPSSIELKRVLNRTHQYIFNMRTMEKPVIASVNGLAVGGGCDLALACDIRIASETAKFSVAYVNVGLHPDLGASYLLAPLVGFGKACELIFTGKMIDAKEAERIGMVNQVVPPEQLKSVTREMALSIAKGPSIAIGYAKTSIYDSWNRDMVSAQENEARIQAVVWTTEDSREGIRAFVEKRKPNFKGR